MKIKVRFESSLRDAAGVPAMDFDIPEGAPIQELLDRLVEVFGNKIIGNDPEYHWRHSANYVVVLRNDESIPRANYAATQLAEGDVVALVPPLAGGSR